ncbi:MAG: hypothetical protein L5655_10730 [Thermosediminibacteraceae bacterium]|nr:hypothetical protein [Thermosediminibacteraceae bacterium]
MSPEAKARRRANRRKARLLIKMLGVENKVRGWAGIHDPTLEAVFRNIKRSRY